MRQTWNSGQSRLCQPPSPRLNFSRLLKNSLLHLILSGTRCQRVWLLSWQTAFAAILADPSRMSTTSRTAPLPPASFVATSQLSRIEGRASAGQALRPTMLTAGKSFTSCPIKQISCRRNPCRSEKRGQRPGFVFAVLVNVTDTKLAG